MPDTIVTAQGRTFKVVPVGEVNGCDGCAAQGDNALCNLLPACDTHVYHEAGPSSPDAPKFAANNGWSTAAGESDPNGVSPHEPGAKLDAGKVRPSLIIEGMARAIWAVSEIATFGAAKYTPGGWVTVPNGQERYADADYRHALKRAMGEVVDQDSKKLHLAHEAWNALAKLDLYLRELEKA